MGGLMAAFGGLMLAGALLRQPWLVEGRKFRRLSESLGPRVAVTFYAVIGAAVLALGILTIAGLWPRQG